MKEMIKENTSRFASSDTADIAKKEVIAEPLSQKAGVVEFPKTKETKIEFEQLLKCVYKDDDRYFMQGVYYDKESGVLVSTNAKRLKFIKVGDFTGFDKSCYVNIDITGKNIVITRNDEMPKNTQFPNYKRVIPSDSAMKIQINLDNKVLSEKIKAMKADGSVSKNAKREREGNKELEIIRVDFKNENVILDETKIGSVEKKTADLPPLYMNVHYLTNAISTGKTSVLFLQEPDTDKFERPMTINTGCSTSIIMPVIKGSVDYEARRAEAKSLKDKKDKKLADRLESNKKQEEELKERFYLSSDKIKKAIETLSTYSNENLIRHLKIANVDLNLLAKKYDFSNRTKNVPLKETGLSVLQTVNAKIGFDKYPETKDALVKEMQKRGILTTEK